MTKMGIETEKKTSELPYEELPHYTQQVQLDPVQMKQSNVWYVLSILATMFCCLPCGLIGLVHSMQAQSDGELGRVGSQKKRIRLAKACTCVSFALGLLVVLAVVAATMVYYYYWYYGYWYVNDYNYYSYYDDDIRFHGWTASTTPDVAKIYAEEIIPNY